MNFFSLISRLVRSLVIGSNLYIESWPLYKRVMLTGNLSILTMVSGLFYYFVDISFGRGQYLYTYALLIGGSLLSLVLLRLGKNAVVVVVIAGDPVDELLDLALHGAVAGAVGARQR